MQNKTTISLGKTQRASTKITVYFWLFVPQLLFFIHCLILPFLLFCCSFAGAFKFILLLLFCFVFVSNEDL